MDADAQMLLAFDFNDGAAGQVIVVGAGSTGDAYELTVGAGGWPAAILTATFTGQLAVGQDRFGNTVAVDPGIAVIAAFFTYGSQCGGQPGIGSAGIFTS